MQTSFFCGESLCPAQLNLMSTSRSTGITAGLLPEGAGGGGCGVEDWFPGFGGGITGSVESGCVEAEGTFEKDAAGLTESGHAITTVPSTGMRGDRI